MIIMAMSLMAIMMPVLTLMAAITGQQGNTHIIGRVSITGKMQTVAFQLVDRNHANQNCNAA